MSINTKSDFSAEELRRQRNRKELQKMLEHVHIQPGEPLSAEEIESEIKAVRIERRLRELRSGKVKGVPLEQVKKKIEKRFRSTGIELA